MKTMLTKMMKIAAAGMVAAGATLSAYAEAVTDTNDVTAVVVGWERAQEALGEQLTAAPASVREYSGLGGTGTYYVVSLEGGGYVVTSGDTSLEPVLAYSKTGTWVDDVKRNPLMAMLEIDIAAAAALETASVQQQGDDAAPQTGGRRLAATASVQQQEGATEQSSANQAKWAKYKAGASQKGGIRLGASAPSSDLRVAALLQSAWSQSGNGENYYTPGASTAGNPGFVCGCVATMCAQIMRYWEWPKGTNITAIANYTGTVTYGKDDAAVSTEWDIEGGYYRTKTATTKTSWTSYSWPAFGGTYDWANMPLTFTYGTSTVQKKAIGHLTRDCGIACGMNYADGGSGAPGPAFAHRAVDQFAYTSGKCVNGWNDANRDALLASLDAGIPCGFCIYGDGGHAVVADGYGYSGGTLYIHFNYGWGSTGPSDWYTPPNVGTFTSVGEIIFNVYPPSVSKHDLTIVSGRVLSGTTAQSSVTVTATNRETGFSTNVTSNSKGIYSFMLPRGYYTFTATKSGSSAKVEADVTPCIAGTASNAKSGNIHGLDLNLGTAVTTPSVALTHRWSFNDNLNDSVGSSNASKIGSNVNLVDGKAVCTGNGAGQGSLNLGSNLLNTDGATIEIWAANDEVKGGSRIFEYGVDTSHYFMMAWTKSTDLYVDSAEAFSGSNNIYDGALAPFTLGRQYHISVTFERQGDGSTKVRAMRRDVASGAIQRVAVYSVTNGIHTFSSPILRLGRSFQGNVDARATYDEVRVWQGVLSDAQLKASALAGPDANLSTLPWNASAVRYVAKAVWQGGATAPTAASLANSANWSCTDQDGDAITGVPDHRSVVIIPNGTTAFTIPEGFTPNWRKLQIGSEGKATAQWGKKTYTQTSVSAQLDPSSADYTLQGDANVDELARVVAPSVLDAPAGLAGNQFRYDGWVYVTAAQAGRWAVSAYADDYAAFRLDDEWLAFTRVMDDGIRTAVADVPKGWHRFTVIIGDYYGGFGGCAMTTDHSRAVPVLVSIDGGNGIAFTSSNFQFGSPDRAAPVVTLAGDADWSSIGEVSLDSGAELDLNGHTLTIDKMESSFLGANIKDTSATPGTIAFAEGGAINSGNITVQSNVKTAYANAEALITAEATFWLDASDTSTITTNASGEVTRWNSRVGSNYATQGRNYFAGSAFLYPTYDATTYGIPTVDFGNAVQSGWDNSNPGRDLNINTPVAVKTVFFVTRIQNDGKAAWLGQEDVAAYTSNCFRRDENGAYNDKRSGQPGQSRFANFWIGTDVVADMTTEHPPADKFCVFSAQMDDAGTYEAQHLAEQCGGLHSGGKQLSELIIFNRALSDEERTEVTQYLQNKWINSRSAALVHRWSFTSDYTDSVGTSHGFTQRWPNTGSADHPTDNCNVSVSDGQAVLVGGNGAGYLNLGTGVVESDDATLEVWVTPGVQPNWAYMFAYGICDVKSGQNGATANDYNGFFSCSWGRGGTSANDNMARNEFSMRYNGTSYVNDQQNWGPFVPGVTYHISITFRKDGNNTIVRWMSRNATTGAIMSERTVTATGWTAAQAATEGWYLTLGHNPWCNGVQDSVATYDEVRVWNGILSDDQLQANVLQGPDKVVGGGMENVVIEADRVFDVPTTGGYGYKTDLPVVIGAGAKIRFDTTDYFGKGLRFKAGGIVVPSGNVLDCVELSDSDNYTATMEDANTILVQLKSTIPYESTWSGGTPSSASDFTNPANWTSVNAQGAAVSAVPTDKTTVIIPAATLASLSMPSGFTPAWGRILLGGHTATKKGKRSGSPNPLSKDVWIDRALNEYGTFADAELTHIYRTSSAGNSPSDMATSILRFDGWVYVDASKAGCWKLTYNFDDVLTFSLDGDLIIAHPTYRYARTSGCYVSEGWHRFTCLAGDTGGGYGAQQVLGSMKYPFVISVNGGSNIAFDSNNFTFGTDSGTVTLTGDANWCALGEIMLNSGLTIDLNGHNLSVAEIDGGYVAATVKDTSGGSSTLTTYTGTVGSGVVTDNITVSKVAVATATWTGAAGDNDVKTPGNWNCYDSSSNLLPGAIPTTDTTVTISDAPEAIASSEVAPAWKWLDLGTVANKTGTLTFNSGSTFSLPLTSNRGLQMGTVANSTGILNVNGGNVTLGNINAPGANVASTVEVNVSAGKLLVNGWVDFGNNESCKATFNQTGGEIETKGAFWFGRQRSSTATFNMRNGTFKTSDGSFHLGQTGNATGIFNQYGGTLNIGHDFRFGINNGAAGKFHQAGGQVVSTVDIYVPQDGRGEFNVGGTVTSGSAKGIYFGTSANGKGELRLRDGGTLLTKFLKKNNSAAQAGLALGAGTLNATAADTTFISGMNGLVFDPGTLTLKTDYAVTVSGNAETHASSGARVAKTGTGTLTIDKLPPVDDFAVNAGTVALSANNASARLAVNAASGNIYPASPSASLLANNYLLHRWDFNGHGLDLVGTNHASIVGKSNAIAYNSASEIQIPGGNRGVGYIDCGSNIIPAELGDTPFTIEFWAKPKSNVNWAQWFAFGNSSDANGTGGALTGLIIAPKSGAGSYPSFRMVGAQTSNNIAIGSGNLTVDKEYHVALVVKPTGNNTATVTAYIEDPSGGEAIRVKSESVTNWSTSTIVQKNFWLGHSHWGDKDVYSTYNEVRVWAAALSQEQVVANGTLGPDVLPVLSATSTLGVTENITVASGATLDLGGHTLTQPRLAGTGTVQNGTLNVGTLAPGGDGTSGAIALNVASVSGVIRIDDGDTFTTTTTGLDLSGATIDLATTPTRSFVVGTASGSGSFAAGRPALTVNGAPLKGWMVKRSGNTLKVSKGGVMILAK